MGKTFWSRRAALTAIGAPLIAGALAAASLTAAADPAPTKFRAIKVDVSPLAGNGLGPEAEWLSHDLPARLQTAFAGRLAPGDRGAPTLVVRISSMYLGQSGGGGTAPFGATAARDGIEGAGVIVAPNGKTVATYPMFTSLIAFTGGSNYEVGTERVRVSDLASSFAQWLPGEIHQ
jgi:hypothetical protein